MYNWQDETIQIQVKEELLKLKNLDYVRNFRINFATLPNCNNKILIEYTVQNQDELSKHKDDLIYKSIIKIVTKNNTKISIIEY